MNNIIFGTVISSVACAAIFASLSISYHANHDIDKPFTLQSNVVLPTENYILPIPLDMPDDITPEVRRTQEEINKISLTVAKRYSRVPQSEIQKIVKAVLKYGNKEGGFPTRWDILAITAIETAFNCSAVSSIGARGCMQINPLAWPDIPNKAYTAIDENIKYGVNILKYFHERHNGDTKATILTYNVGYAAYTRGNINFKYFTKFSKEKQKLLDIYHSI